eukprot:414477-Pleurochrysis_carterae.AAC.2
MRSTDGAARRKRARGSKRTGIGVDRAAGVLCSLGIGLGPAASELICDARGRARRTARPRSQTATRRTRTLEGLLT